MTAKIVYICTKIYHCKQYRKGDLEDGYIENTIVFPTRKSANEYLQQENSIFIKQGLKPKINLVSRGDKPSELIVFTGNTWINENSGEKCEEYYWYKVEKQIKL